MELASSQAIHRELVCRSEAIKQTLRAFPWEPPSPPDRPTVSPRLSPDISVSTASEASCIALFFFSQVKRIA
jgi:hypothetical protein